jgi:hypothetical protein
MPGTSTFRAYCRLQTVGATLFWLLLTALPVSAQIQGYGKDATGGAGQSVCTVTSSAASGAGSFDSCLSQGANRTIQFAVASVAAGTSKYLRSNTTIDGCANGQNGVTIDSSGGTGRSVIIEGPTSNVIVRCIRFVGSGTTSEGSDLLSLDGTGGQISRVAVDRSSFISSPDGALDITGDVSDLTVQKSLFYGTALTQLIKYDTRMRISLHHNVYTAGGERNPQIKGDATKIDFVSNVVNANTLTADSYGTLLSNGNSSSDSAGNVQINVVANAYVGTNGNLKITTESGASAAGIYIAPNNYCSPASNCPASPASTPFTVAAGYEVTPTLPGCMVANMLPAVGAPNRSATDTQRINAVAAALPNSCGSASMPTLSINDVSVTEGNAGTTTATFTVTLSAAATSTVSVNYATANGTATAGSDYVATSGTLTFPAGTTTKTVPVTVNGDTTVEANETFVVNLSVPVGATLADAQGTGTITNDDVACTSSLQISIADKSITEGNTGSQLVAFPVTLSGASNCTVSVSYATANGTATAGSDYLAVASTVAFAPGVTTQSVYVTVNGDKVLESNETFLVNLSAPSGATLLDSQAVGTIVNDDVAGFSANDVTVVEPVSGTVTATFTVTLAPAASVATTIAYATANGTATAGSDYVAKSGTLTFAAGVTTQTVAVVVNADAVREAIETFTLNLSNPTGGPAIADPQGTGRIYNTGAYFTLTPCRLIDTRNAAGALAGPALKGNTARTFTLAGACGIPANARALVLNATVTSPTAAGDLAIYPAGVAPPLTSVINYTAGRTRANNLTVSVNAQGQVTVRCDQATGTTVQFILDVDGYYQ